jgi:hypothetical protein
MTIHWRLLSGAELSPAITCGGGTPDNVRKEPAACYCQCRLFEFLQLLSSRLSFVGMVAFGWPRSCQQQFLSLGLLELSHLAGSGRSGPLTSRVREGGVSRRASVGK